MKSKLDEIESKLQALIEKSLPFLQAPSLRSDLAGQITNVLQDSWILENGMIIAPNRFIIFLHPDTAKEWGNERELLSFLENCLQESAQEAGVCFASPPKIQISPTSALQPGEIRVSSSDLEKDAHEKTAMLQISSALLQEKSDEKANFLIVNGIDLYTLENTVTRIGRSPDNHLVIDDPRISRNHAQIRLVRGKYVIFDLNSTGGTFINGTRISQQTLKPGDVISLAGFPIIFGEDSIVQTQNNDQTSMTGKTSRVEPSEDSS